MMLNSASSKLEGWEKGSLLRSEFFQWWYACVFMWYYGGLICDLMDFSVIWKMLVLQQLIDFLKYYVYYFDCMFYSKRKISIYGL